MVITTTDIQLFQILKQKLGEEKAEALVNLVTSEIKQSNLSSIASKGEIFQSEGKVTQSKRKILTWMFILWIVQIVGYFWLYTSFNYN